MTRARREAGQKRARQMWERGLRIRQAWNSIYGTALDGDTEKGTKNNYCPPRLGDKYYFPHLFLVPEQQPECDVRCAYCGEERHLTGLLGYYNLLESW